MYASVCPSFENWRLAVVAKICPLFCPKKFLVGGYCCTSYSYHVLFSLVSPLAKVRTRHYVQIKTVNQTQSWSIEPSQMNEGVSGGKHDSHCH
jgi:hypothetical protein